MIQLPFFERLQPLTDEIIKQKAPAVFAQAPKGVSDRYTFIPTTRVIEDMRGLGWDVYSVGQRGSRKNRSMTNKHSINFRNYDLEKIGDLYPEITLVNSHDGTNAFRFYLGLYNPNSNDSYLVRNELINNLSIRHQWYELSEVRSMVTKVVSYLPQLKEEMELLTKIKLNRVEQIRYATQAARFRWKENTPDIVQDLIRAKNQISENTLWEVFTFVQNKLIKGGMKYITPTKRHQTVRQIKSIDLKIKLNKELWDYTKGYVEKKKLMVEVL